MTLKHTPYDGSHPLFKIGLEQLDLNDWIEADEHLDFYLSEKQRLCDLYGDKVFKAEGGTEQSQREVLELLIDYLPVRFPNIYRLSTDRNEMDIALVPKPIDLNATGMPPLAVAANLVQEDLILMRKGENGWRLAAASLCFPSSWSLVQKFGKPLDQIHAPVPEFGTGTRNASMIERIFDNLLVDQPVRRFNWSVYCDDELFHDDRAAEHLRKQSFDAGIFMRVEHQTLRKLPVSGDILFTVRIHIDPFKSLADRPDRRRICNGAIKSLKELDAAQLAYKGLAAERDRLIEKLFEIAERVGQQ